MNTLTSHTALSPYGKEEECAKFVIDEPAYPFVLAKTTVLGQNYTFNCWFRSDAEGNIILLDNSFICSSEGWSRISVKFTADSEDLIIYFGSAGTYYLYHPQLEIGNVMTDWTPAPEDVDESISEVSASLSILSNEIKMEFAATNEVIQETKDGIDAEFAELKKCITYGFDGITITNGEQGKIRLVLDNTGISFYKSGQAEPFGFWDGDNFLTGNIVVRVEERAQFGDFAFVPRSDGSLSFLKVGG